MGSRHHFRWVRFVLPKQRSAGNTQKERRNDLVSPFEYKRMWHIGRSAVFKIGFQCCCQRNTFHVVDIWARLIPTLTGSVHIRFGFRLFPVLIWLVPPHFGHSDGGSLVVVLLVHISHPIFKLMLHFASVAIILDLLF